MHLLSSQSEHPLSELPSDWSKPSLTEQMRKSGFLSHPLIYIKVIMKLFINNTKYNLPSPTFNIFIASTYFYSGSKLSVVFFCLFIVLLLKCFSASSTSAKEHSLSRWTDVKDSFLRCRSKFCWCASCSISCAQLGNSFQLQLATVERCRLGLMMEISMQHFSISVSPCVILSPIAK